MAKAKDIPNVVEVTNQAGLFEQFEDLQARLTLCENPLPSIWKPRDSPSHVYFVAQADLLDILSNGNNPRVIATHLSKLFDNTTDLKFKGEEKSPLECSLQKGSMLTLRLSAIARVKLRFG